MKKSRFRYLFLPALLLAVLPFACSERWQDSETGRTDRPDFTLADAKRAFEAIYFSGLSTRTDDLFDEERILDPYRIDPAWESGSFCSGDSFLQVLVPFSARYGYRVLRCDEDKHSSLAPLPSFLVVLKDSDTDDVSSWLYFLIPDAHEELSAGSPFSGTALYATLSGLPVSAGRYVDGSLVSGASLFDDTRTWEENIGRLAGLLPEASVARLQAQISTRGVNDNNQIEPVEIIGHAPIKIPDPFPKTIYPENPPVPPPFDKIKIRSDGDSEGGGGGIGSGTGSSSSSEKIYWNNSHITADDETREILDSLYNDCMGQQLINAIHVDVPIVRDPNRNGCAVSAETSTYSSGRQETSYQIFTGKSLSSISLMEELMHIYQGFGTPAFGTAKLNREIEAKLTWYIYMQKHNIQKDVLSALGGRMGKDYFDIMRSCILSNDLEHEMFPIAYEYAADALRNIKAYKDETKYRFDPNDRDLSNLLKLLEDCIGKYRIE